MPSPQLSTGYHIASVLAELHDLFWELEAENKAKDIQYTDEDVMHALKVFMHVASNVAIHDSIDSKETLQESLDRHQEYGRRLAELTLEMTGVDPRTFYHRKA